MKWYPDGTLYQFVNPRRRYPFGLLTRPLLSLFSSSVRVRLARLAAQLEESVQRRRNNQLRAWPSGSPWCGRLNWLANWRGERGIRL
jgi:hypothetical protein